jgi:hypothetical protein
VTLTGCQKQHERFATTFGTHMHFRPKATPTPAQRLLLLPSVDVSSASRMLMCPYMGAVHKVDTPIQATRSIALALQNP